MWNPFRKKPSSESSFRDAELKILAGFEPAMQRVRDLETVGDLFEARKLFESLSKACLAIPVISQDLFFVLCKLYEELRRRRYVEESSLVLSKLKACTLVEDEKNLSLVLALETKNSFDTQIFYCCQNCGELIAHVSTPCDSCSFLPLSIEDCYRAIALSSAGLGNKRIVRHGDLIRRNKAIADGSIDLRDVSAKISSDPQFQLVAKNILDLCLKINPLNYRALSDTTICNSCQKSFEVIPPFVECPWCRSSDTGIEPIRMYKNTLRLTIRWLQGYATYQDNTSFTQVISSLIELKEDSIQFGRSITPERGIPLQHQLESLSPIVTRDERFQIIISPFRTHGETLRLDEGEARIGPEYEIGPLLFNSLSRYLRKGVVI